MKIALNIQTLSMLAVAAALTGCATSGPSPSVPPVAAAPKTTPFDGEWASADGVASSRFANGVFTTVDTGSGNKVADGSYVIADGRTANITVKSLVRGTTSNVTCLLATETQLNCTNSAGAQFVLNKRAIAPV